MYPMDLNTPALADETPQIGQQLGDCERQENREEDYEVLELRHAKTLAVYQMRIVHLNRIYPGFQKYLDWDFLRKETRGVVFR